MPRAERGRRPPARPGPDTDPAGTPWGAAAPLHEPTALHEARLGAVCEALQVSGARRVADLGCGDGLLVRRLLADAHFERIVALDVSLGALAALERSVPVQALRSGRLVLVQGTFTQPHRELAGVDAVAMLETIEHVEPARLSGVEQLLFARIGAPTVVMTTPNQEYNELFGMAPGQLREPGHRFEWTRARFRAWAQGAALRHGYDVRFAGIGDADPWRGSPTQMAVFSRNRGADAALA